MQRRWTSLAQHPAKDFTWARWLISRYPIPSKQSCVKMLPTSGIQINTSESDKLRKHAGFEVLDAHGLASRRSRQELSTCVPHLQAGKDFLNSSMPWWLWKRRGCRKLMDSKKRLSTNRFMRARRQKLQIYVQHYHTLKPLSQIYVPPSVQGSQAAARTANWTRFSSKAVQRAMFRWAT